MADKQSTKPARGTRDFLPDDLRRREHVIGIVIVAAMGIAFFLPPVGVGLSIAAGIARVDIDAVSRSYVPYLVALLVGLALIAAFPVLTLVLPRLLLGYKG